MANNYINEIDSELNENSEIVSSLEGVVEVNREQGTSDYNKLNNRPSINNVELVGNKTSEELGLANISDIPVVPSKVSDFENDAGYLKEVPSEYVTETELNDRRYATTDEVETELADYVKNTDYAFGKAGVVSVVPSNGRGIDILSGGILSTKPATKTQIDEKKNNFLPLTSATNDYAVKVALTTNEEPLTDEEKAKALTWLGAPSKEKTVLVDGVQTINAKKSFPEVGLISQGQAVYEEKTVTNEYDYEYETVSGGFSLQGDGYYQSVGGYQGSYICRIYFEMFKEHDLVISSKIVASMGSDAESSLIFGRLDEELSVSENDNGENAHDSLIYHGSATLSEVSKTITYNNVSKGDHFICIKFAVPYNGDYVYDSLGYFKIESPVGLIEETVMELVGYESIEGILDVNADGGLSFNGVPVPTKGQVDKVEALAKGANQAKGFNNYKELVDAFNQTEKGSWNSGQIFNIVTTKVPDLWVVREADEFVEFSYIDDATIVNILNTNGTFQVGYYILGAMETGKVDLTDYPTNTEMETAINEAISTSITTVLNSEV